MSAANIAREVERDNGYTKSQQQAATLFLAKREVILSSDEIDEAVREYELQYLEECFMKWHGVQPHGVKL